MARCCAIVAAMSFALAATLWQKASMDAGVEPGDSKGLLGLLTNPVWLLGLLAQGVGVPCKRRRWTAAGSPSSSPCS